MILAAALDLDGTIIGPDEKIAPAVQEAIGKEDADQVKDKLESAGATVAVQ